MQLDRNAWRKSRQAQSCQGTIEDPYHEQETILTPRKREHTVKRTFILSVAPVVTFFSAVLFGQGRVVPMRVAIVHSSTGAEGHAVQEGLLHRLAEEGYDATTLQWTVYNIDGDRAKATEIATRLASERVDLIVPIGTMAARALVQEIKYIPIVFRSEERRVGKECRL